MFDDLKKVINNIGKGSVEEAHASLNDVLTRLDPLLHNVFNRIGGILHGLLDRFDVDIKIKLNPVEKGHPPIEPDSQTS
jgi:hypothetical protein